MTSLQRKHPTVNHCAESSECDEKELKHVSDEFPWSIFLVSVTELSERFTYRSISAPMREAWPFLLLSSNKQSQKKKKKKVNCY